jgi:hypothetical protein
MREFRGHQPIVIDKFNGLWRRGDPDDAPMDHFTDCNNIQFVGDSAFRTRPGINISQNVGVPLSNVKRVYNYPTQTANTLIVLCVNGSNGEIYHVVNSTTTFGPILTIAGMTDFAFVPIAGRAYISPFATFDVGGLNVEKGLSGESLYVYAGDGTAARVAAGAALSGSLMIANGAAGFTDAGEHLFAFVAETISGYLTPPGAITAFTTSAASSVSFGSVPTSGDPNVVRRHLVATKVIEDYDGNELGYQFFFVPNATIENDTDTFLNNISFFDADLLEDASYLFDNYATIPAGAVLSTYQERLVLAATFDDISLALVSFPGEPEAISQVDGLIIFPLDGNPITNAAELRDVLYLTKRSKTGGWTDNGDVPSTWEYQEVDTALGTSVHGIATVLDSGGASVDYLIIATYQGMCLFNGRYIQPELSWKIEDYWKAFDRNDFRFIQMVNAPIQKEIYMIQPDRTLLVGNYSNGMDPMKIKWSPWTFFRGVNTVAISQIDDIIIGSDIE